MFGRETGALPLIGMSNAGGLPSSHAPSNSHTQHPPPPLPYSDHGGQFVYEVIDGVDHQLDVVLLRHAVLAVPTQDHIHVGAEDALGHLHGDVPGDVFVLQAVDEPHGAGDGDGAL